MARSRRYVALLRAVNVGGTGVMRMADLRTRCEQLGLEDVSTHIQTGNVLFRSERSATQLATLLERELGHDAFVLTPAQLRKALAANPLSAAGDTERQCVLVFLSATPSPQRRAALLAAEAPPYRFALEGRVFSYAYAKADAAGRRTIDVEKALGVRGTGRSAKVVQRLIELAGDA